MSFLDPIDIGGTSQGAKYKSATKLLVLPLLFVVGGIAWFSTAWSGSSDAKEDLTETASAQETEQVVESGIDANQDITEYLIQSGDTFDSVMEQLNITPSERQEILLAAEDIYDLARLKVGKAMRIAVNDDSSLSRLEYEYNSENVLIVERLSDSFTAKQEIIEYDIEIAQADGNIDSSLFAAGAEAGLTDAVIMEITDILAWQVDFVSEVKKDDSFQVIYEKRFRDGEYVDYGRILGVVFSNQGQEYWAVFYKDPEGKKAYYDLDGSSVKKAFLKSPLQYSSVSSGYTNSRFHPVLKKYLPHRAIDYAAAAGTPVAAVGGGKVTYAGLKGGDGIYVEIKHNETFVTKYSHLQGIAEGIKVGARVDQGDVIGYVGSTGYSTGPHLQYAMAKNGQAVNPTEVDLPSGDPVAEQFKDEFLVVANKLKEDFDK